MNSKKCKLLRRMVYGDYSQREERKYIRSNGQIINDPNGRRGRYLEGKRNYKARRQNS